MSLLNDGINIATFMGIPKKLIVWSAVILVVLGGTVWVTYKATCAYQEHNANLEDLRAVLNLQKQLNAEFINLKTSEVNGFIATETAINNLSITIERTTNDELEMFDRLARDNALLHSIFVEKQKHITETRNDYLPHLNCFKIGVTPIP